LVAFIEGFVFIETIILSVGFPPVSFYICAYCFSYFFVCVLTRGVALAEDCSTESGMLFWTSHGASSADSSWRGRQPYRSRGKVLVVLILSPHQRWSLEQLTPFLLASLHVYYYHATMYEKQECCLIVMLSPSYVLRVYLKYLISFCIVWSHRFDGSCSEV
jgi:hypothetical protein